MTTTAKKTHSVPKTVRKATNTNTAKTARAATKKPPTVPKKDDRKKYLADLDKKMKEYKEKISKITDKAEYAEEEAKARLKEDIKELKDKYKGAETAYETLKASTEDTYEEIKGKVVDVFDELKKGFTKFTKLF